MDYVDVPLGAIKLIVQMMRPEILVFGAAALLGGIITRSYAIHPDKGTYELPSGLRSEVSGALPLDRQVGCAPIHADSLSLGLLDSGAERGVQEQGEQDGA